MLTGILWTCLQAAGPSNGVTPLGSNELAIGGVGGLYLYAEPGELTVRITKRDRNEGSRENNLRAILVGPDRRPLDEGVIPDDGRPRGSGLGPANSVTLSTNVERAGIYAVNVTVTHDRYGEAVVWSFSTNCERTLVETSRGHKDARHVEPIVLAGPDGPADICFAPRSERFDVNLAELPSGCPPATLFDADGGRIAELSVGEDGTARASIPAGDRRASPWRLHVPVADATVEIDGVTRWERGERFENLSLWSTSPEAWFPLVDHRWLLTPYRHAFHAQTADKHPIRFDLHNNADRDDTISLAAEGDLPVDLPDSSFTLAPGEMRTVTVTARPEGAGSARLVAKSSLSGLTTWSTIEARDGTPDYAFDPPMVYRPYEHENEQFAYTPDYPNDNQLYFTPGNRPLIRTDDGLHALTDGGWRVIDTVDGERYRAVGSKVAFGGDGAICLLGRGPSGVAYLRSENDGASWTATPIPVREAPRQQWDIEQFAGHNVPDGPAPFLRASETGEYDPSNFWRHVNDLELFLPALVDGEVVIGDPILLSSEAIGISSHSGIPSSIVSRGRRVHVVWGEATDPDGDAPGVPAYIATYDRDTGGLLGEKTFVGYGPPANDVHNTPSVVIDSEGYLHTLTGTHGQPFAYARSLEPNTAHAGFTDPELVEEDLRSTYIGFVCGPDDTLHLVFRTWKEDGEYHPLSHYANLAYKRKPKDGPWEPMRRLAVAPFTEYSIWYHRLTLDRAGRLFVSFDYWSTFWFYRVDHYGHAPGRGQAGGGGRRKTILSADGGETWKLLETSDLE